MKNLAEILRGKNLYSGFLHVALLVLAVEVVVLAKQNRELKNPVNPQFETLKSGEYFPLGNLQALQPEYQIDSTSRQILFVFTTTCPFCKKNLENLNLIFQQIKRHVYVMGISLDSIQETEKFTKENRLDFPVYVVHDGKFFAKTNKIHGVPKTILRNEKGRVEKLWNGLLSERQISEIVNAISQNLNTQLNLNGGSS